MSRIAITGCGAVDPRGCGRAALLEALRSGAASDRQEMDRSAGYHRAQGARFGGKIAVDALREWLSPREARRMSPPSRFAVAAAHLAFAEAKLDIGNEPSKVAVVTSTSYGPSFYTEELLKQILQDQPTAASPFLFTEAVANAPAAQIALRFKATGPNLTITQRETGPLQALALAARQIERQRAESAVVAAVDELNALQHSILDRFGTLAGSRGGAEEIARPFDRRRSGCFIAEGGTALVLEPEDAARRRGAKIQALLRGSIQGFDPSAPATSWSASGQTLAPILRRGLERAGVNFGDIDLIVSGTSGNAAADALEADVLRRAWDGQTMPPIFVPKAWFGEHGGALLSGALLAEAGVELAPTPGFEQVDPALGITPHTGGPIRSASLVLVTALAAGGAATWALLERPA